MSDSTAEAALLAKQALKALAQSQTPPTPENYAFHYELARSRLTGKAPPRKEAELDPALIKRAIPTPEAIAGALAIVEAFLINLSDLYPDNPALREQVEILRDVLMNPHDAARALTAKKTLAKARAPQIHTHLSAAKMEARRMSEQFLGHMSEAEQATDRLVTELKTQTQEEAGNNPEPRPALNINLKDSILALARATASSLSRSRDEMIQTRARAEEALSSIRHLEAKLVKASEEAKRDYLTGLLNRRGLDEELSRVFVEAITPPTLALLDIDNFKAINDTLGHEGGDQALKILSKAIQEILSGSGSPARMGGEEFLIIFPEIDAKAAKAAVQALQRALTTKFYMEAAGERLITFSAGVAQRVGAETPAETIARADEAMYAAKRLGKNRVEIAAENQEREPSDASSAACPPACTPAVQGALVSDNSSAP